MAIGSTISGPYTLALICHHVAKGIIHLELRRRECTLGCHGRNAFGIDASRQKLLPAAPDRRHPVCPASRSLHFLCCLSVVNFTDQRLRINDLFIDQCSLAIDRGVVSLRRRGENRFLLLDHCSLVIETYNALTGQVIRDINSATVNASTAPEGTDPARYVYAPDGNMVLREMGVFGATTPSQYIYALTDPSGTVVAIAGASGAVDGRYVFNGLRNGQALQANGTAYDPTTFTNPNRSANWQFQQQFSGSVFFQNKGT